MAGRNTLSDASIKRLNQMSRELKALRDHIRSGSRAIPKSLRPRLCKLVDVSPASGGVLPKNAVGTFATWSGDPGSETATGEQFQACAKFGSIPDTSVFCGAWHNGRGFYVHVRECTTEEEEA